MHASLGTMLHNRTGSWRFIKPVYEDKTPACQNGCPAGNDIEGWLTLLRRKEFEAAYWHLKREEPFPAILGRVCFAFCENACNRASFDGCVGVRDMERFVGDLPFAKHPHPDLERAGDNGKRLAVVGSGPAGMSAAYFARLLGFSVMIFEALPEPGGVLRVGIPAYRLPREVVAAEFDALFNMGVALRLNTAVGADIPFDRLRSDFDYIFLASGVHRSMALEIVGNGAASGVISGLSMLKKVALGEDISLGKRVVVVGGGNTAIDAARTAVRMGCDTMILYRRSEAEMPAHPEEIAEAREEGVQFRFLAAPEDIVRAEDGSARQLVCHEMTLGPADESGRRRPIPKDGANFTLDVDTVVTAIGERADFTYLAGASPTLGTTLSVDGALRMPSESSGGAKIYAGGDIIEIPHTVVHAVASGKRAAIAIDRDRKGVGFPDVAGRIAVGNANALSFSKYLGMENIHPVRRNDRVVVDQTGIVFDYFEKVEKPVAEKRPGESRKADFAPYRETLTEAEALAEAARCLHCGRCTECDNCLIFCPDISILKKEGGAFGYEIDDDYCKGCGICAAECPRGAITMIGEAVPVDDARSP